MHKQVMADYQYRLSQRYLIPTPKQRQSYSEELLNAYLNLMGVEQTLEDLRRDRDNEAAAQYEEFLKTRYNLTLKDAGQKLIHGMQHRDEHLTRRRG